MNLSSGDALLSLLGGFCVLHCHRTRAGAAHTMGSHRTAGKEQVYTIYITPQGATLNTRTTMYVLLEIHRCPHD